MVVTILGISKPSHTSFHYRQGNGQGIIKENKLLMKSF